MTILHQYQKQSDFQAVGDFLIAHYQACNQDGNWLQPTWEYMHSHPNLDEDSLEKIRIWMDDGEIVGVAHYESTLGEAFFEIHPAYTHLKAEMLAYAECNLYGVSASGERFLFAYVNDFDTELERLVHERGYERDADNDRPMSMLRLSDPLPEATLPTGYQVKSLAENNDLYKINRVLWRGFNHPGEPPEEEIPGRVKMQSVPNFRREINMVTEAPDGNFACFCGLWYEPVNHLAYVEPVATDPDYRRMGLAKAALFEGLRRCQALGATVAHVGSEQKFYQALGFKKIYTSQAWRKSLG